MEAMMVCKDYTDTGKENALHHFNPKKLSSVLQGLTGKILPRKDILGIGVIEERIKIEEGETIYILTHKQVEEINDVLRGMEPDQVEDLADYLQKTEDIDHNRGNMTGLITFTSGE